MKKLITEVGDYQCYVQKKGEMEACIKGIREGQLFWTVILDNEGSGFDTLSQSEAIIIGELLKIKEAVLKKRGGKNV